MLDQFLQIQKLKLQFDIQGISHNCGDRNCLQGISSVIFVFISGFARLRNDKHQN